MSFDRFSSIPRRTIKEFIDQNLPKMQNSTSSLNFTPEDKKIFEILGSHEGDLTKLNNKDLSYISAIKFSQKSSIMDVFYREFKTDIDRVLKARTEDFLNDSGQESQKSPGM